MAIIFSLDENDNFQIKLTYKNYKIRLANLENLQVNYKIRKNLARILIIKNNEQQLTIDDFPADFTVNDGNLTIGFNSTSFLAFDIQNNQITMLTNKLRKLVVFETRMIGRLNNEYQPLQLLDVQLPITDLHTHLSAQLSSKKLMEIGLKHNILLPVVFFEQRNLTYNKKNLQQIPKRKFLPTAHLDDQQNTELAIPIRDLSTDQLSIYSQSLSLSFANQSSFEDIENCYYWREPFTKNINLLADILFAMAIEYQNSNIKYAELSTNAIIDANWLLEIEKHVDLIEQKTGVIFRFLVGIPRNLSSKQLINRTKAIQDVSYHPLIVGLDLLGYEINKTIHFEQTLANLATWIKANRSDFIYRIHAGENTKNPTNVKDALLFAMEHQVKIRVGHALHGLDEETIELAYKLSNANLLIIEFNPDSNLASNNIDFPHDMPMRRVIKAGIKCVLGSDGAGLYQTNTKQTMIAAQICGLKEQDFNKIRTVEQQYIDNKITKTSNLNISTYQPAVCELVSSTKSVNKIPILIAGATGSSWLSISLKVRQEIRRTFKLLISRLDPQKVVFVTGRSKDQGIAVELGKIITLHNFAQNQQFDYLSMVAEVSETNSIKPKGISTIKEFTTPIIYLPSGTINYIKQQQGIAIFIGGKSFTRDFILEADKQELFFALMSNIAGASGDKARLYKSNAFDNAKQLIDILENNRPELIIK